jgi:hypothetical protein
LLVRSTGRVTGTVHYGELELERGGRLAGSVGVREPLRGLGSDQIPGPIDGTAASAAEGQSATVASLRPSSKPGSRRGQGTPAGNGTDHGQLPKAS